MPLRLTDLRFQAFSLIDHLFYITKFARGANFGAPPYNFISIHGRHDMSNFKDDLATDVDITFMDLDEFAEIHNVDGKEMPAVVDDYEAIKQQESAGFVNGTYQKRILLYAPKAEFEKKPSTGTRIFSLDGKKYRVFEVSEEGNVYAITLEVSAGR